MRWEDGEIKTITISATAGNVTSSKSPGASKKWKILYGRIVLVNDATVANRNLNVTLYNTGGTKIGYDAYATNLAASATGYYVIHGIHGTAQGNANTTSWATADFYLSGGDCIISGTDKIQFSVANGVAGDSYSGTLHVIELPNASSST